MKERPLAAAYWGPRPESQRACAERMQAFLAAIASVPGLDGWFHLGRSRATATKPLVVDIDAIQRTLRPNHRDTDRAPIPELGFRMGVWNGRDDRSASLSIHCAATVEVVKNAVVLNLPTLELPLDDSAIESLRTVMEALIGAWDPDNAVVTTRAEIARAGGGPPWAAGGWLTYRRGGKIREQT